MGHGHELEQSRWLPLAVPGDGAGIGVVVFLQAVVIGVSSWPRRRLVGFTVAFAACHVWAGLVLTDGLAPAG